MRTLLLVVLLGVCGCEEIRRNGRPGDTGYIAPQYVKVKVIEFEPDLLTEVAGRAFKRAAYSVVEDENGKRYHVLGRVGPIGDSFKMDVSLMEEIGS
jgi:hypothetical protein